MEGGDGATGTQKPSENRPQDREDDLDMEEAEWTAGTLKPSGDRPQNNEDFDMDVGGRSQGANKGSSRNSSQKRPKAGDRISSENLDNGVRNRDNRLCPPTIQGIDQSDKALGKRKAPPLHLEPTSKKTKSEKKRAQDQTPGNSIEFPIDLV